LDFIFIEEMRVDAHVGIYPRERVAAQTLELNLTFGVPDDAAQGDDINKTIDYAVVIARIREDLAQNQFNLLETLGEHIMSLMFDEFGAPWVKISLAKIGVAKGVKRVGVQIERRKNEV
jgi:dihydroneopterin aldolase